MKKILVVEDVEDNRELLVQFFADEYEVLEAEDGRQGIEMARRLRPDLVLMDLSLPVLDGWRAAGEMKKDPQLKNIPIVAITAHAMVGDEQKARSAGCDEYITKPVDFDQLKQVVRKLLG